MKRIYLDIALLTLALSAPVQAAEQESRTACEDGARLMKLEGDKAAAYVTECLKAQQEEEARE